MLRAQPCRCNKRSSSRCGFTLLEVLLALVVGSALLAGVYGALSLHWQMNETGRVEMERAQVARALLDRMALDVRSVVFTDPEKATADSETSEDDEGSADQTVNQVEVIDPVAVYTEQSVGVFGDSQTLILHISKPTRDFENTSGSDLKSVAYFLAGSGGSALGEAVGEAAINAQTSQTGTGLARMEGDRLEMQFSDASGDLETLAAQTQLLAEEVEFLMFEYYDGYGWLEAWDSIQMGALPKAIRITIGFRAIENEQNAMIRRSAHSSTNEYSLTVALPMAGSSAEDEL